MTQKTFRTGTLVLTWTLMALALSPLVPGAVATHCDGAITVASLKPFGLTPSGALTVEARFNDATRCGIVDWSMTINGNQVPSDAFNTDGQYVITYTDNFSPGTYLVHVRVEEPCCNNGEQQGDTNDFGEATWQFIVSPAGVAGTEFSLAPAGEVTRVTIHEPSPSLHVAGFVDLYRFTLPGDVVVTIPCVVLVQDGATVDPCSVAGGTFTSRIATLVDESASEPGPPESPPLRSVGVCNAVLTLTVSDVGVNSAPAFTLC